MSDLPTYPSDAAEREAAERSAETSHDFASWGRRFGAYLLDTVIILVPLFAIAFAIGFAAGGEDEDAAIGALGLAYVLTAIAPFIYFTYFHGRESGQTPGKKALGIRVVADRTGGSIGYGRAFGRYAITFVFGILILPLLINYLWPLWDEKNQALHDKVVGSVVVKAWKLGPTIVVVRPVRPSMRRTRCVSNSLT